MKKEKIALLVDSTSGFSKIEADKLGIFFVPVTLTVDGKWYKDGIDITELEFVKKINTEMKISTAAPSIGQFQEEYRRALKTYDKVFYFGYTSKMSGTWNVGVQASKDKEFDGKIFAPETKYMSAWQNVEVHTLIKMIKNGASIEDLTKRINDQNEAIVGYMTTNTLVYLKNGGRVSSVTAFIGSLLKIIPIPCFINGTIDKELSDKVRTWSKAKNRISENLKPYWDRIKDKTKFELVLISSPIIPKKELDEFKSKVISTLDLNIDYKFAKGTLGVGVTAHIGATYFGLGIRLK